MKGIILAGGTGSRLYPMIYRAVYKLKQCEITDIIIITEREHMGDVVNFLGSGHEFGGYLRIVYRIELEELLKL